MFARRLLAVWLGAWLWTLSAHAAAQDLLVVAVGGDASEPLREPVIEAVARRFAADGFDVVDPVELAHRFPASRLAPPSTSEAGRLAAELGVPRVACVSVWMEAGAVHELSLSLHALAGGRSVSHELASGVVTPEASVEGVIDAMVVEVLERARARALLDPGTVTSAPSAPSSSVSASSGSSDGAPPVSEGLRMPIVDGSSSASTRRASGEAEPLFGFIGPTLLAALGAAGIGLGIWASLDSTCDRYNADRSVCLRGEQQNLAAGIPLMLGGAVALAGAIAWWVIGADAPVDGSRIEVSLAPERLLVRGTF